ncbi:MAG TPA: hypothetical protein VHZ51_17020 [Ktedonobacteraceae bacterium]|jgi:hypothetical protein|nr:hypothetical protein [Ktedonobacteraceae bacterium]
MAASKDERNRILQLIELQQITADQAAELLDAMGDEPVRVIEQPRERTIRLRATTLKAGIPQSHVMANLPVSLLRTSFKLGANMFPQVSKGALEDVLRAIERGNAGRLLDVQDLEKGERLEIFVE